MKRRTYGPDRDPVSRHLGDDPLGHALAELAEPVRKAVIHWALGAPFRQLERELGVFGGEAELLVSAGFEQLEKSRHADALREELQGAHGPLRSPVLRVEAGRVVVHRCERAGCTAPPLQQPATGRPRRYCSNACRQKAYYLRKRTPGRLPEQTGTRPYLLRDYWRDPRPPGRWDASRWISGILTRYERQHARALPDPELNWTSERVRAYLGRVVPQWPTLQQEIGLGDIGPREPAQMSRALWELRSCGYKKGPAWTLNVTPPESRDPTVRHRHRLANPLQVWVPRRPEKAWAVPNKSWFPLPPTAQQTPKHHRLGDVRNGNS